MSETNSIINVDIIQNRIFTFRGIQVMVDRDLAEMYQVETKVLNQAVKRNIVRFPDSFRFQLSDNEKIELVTICDRFQNLKHSSVNPYVFTEQGVFFDGQIFDAYKLLSDIIRSARKSIVLIDNYVDDTVLNLFSKKDKKVNCIIFTKIISKQFKLDTDKFNKQYPTLKLKQFSKAHDRFLIIDQNEVYHIGASLKDLGKKWFAFTKMDK
ncbi:MAG: ORF6N domain-containing protein, partial [Bacteroidales bacterium]|nr:ORF6N domain-containing protein [Bacteroidales bacterium]